jgi:general secretion pathway protein E
MKPSPAAIPSIEERVLGRLGITPAIGERILARRHATGRAVPDLLAEDGLAPPDAWPRAIAAEVGLPFRSRLPEAGADPSLVDRLPMSFAMRHALAPLGIADGRVEVAVADLAGPEAVAVLGDLALLYGRPVRPLLASAPAIREALARAYDAAALPALHVLEGITRAPLERLAEAVSEPQDLLDASGEAPLVRLVNALLAEAIAARASDIHIEPSERTVGVRFRIDGMLHDVLNPPQRLQPSLFSRLKVMASLDIAERRLPQDGRIRLRAGGRDVDVRVSIVPTIFGERAVLRILDRSARQLSLDQLGFRPDTRERFERLLARSHGIVLVTGPTGSGKTTTLYAALTHILAQDRGRRNLLTIEDPVEYQLPGIGQMQVNPKIDLTFAQGLRSILRQDPDVIMVGEIRDRETAEIAIHAALTGHLVLSTLHTTDSVGALTRLADMGIEPFLVSSAVVAVLGQRLVRRLCEGCRLPEPPAPERIAEAGLTRAGSPDLGTRWRAGPGCAQCRATGYRGRAGVFELLALDDALRRLVMARADAASLRRRAVCAGLSPLREDGLIKVAGGLTSLDELLRVTRDDI